jgi:hypothetical protein
MLGDDNEVGNEVGMARAKFARARVTSKVDTSNLLINGVSNWFFFPLILHSIALQDTRVGYIWTHMDNNMG